MALFAHALPDFPWDTLKGARDRAARYPAGEIDLTIGSPVDPVPQFARDTLAEASDAHSYPPNTGSRDVREAIRRWVREQRDCLAAIDVLPILGEKEMVAMLPALLGFGPGHTVAFPDVAYPTYDVGARLTGATPVPLNIETDPATWPTGINLLWLNSPSNPTGHVLSVEQLRAILAWARSNGTIVASDECYAALTFAQVSMDESVVGSAGDRDVAGYMPSAEPTSANSVSMAAGVQSASEMYRGELAQSTSCSDVEVKDGCVTDARCSVSIPHSELSLSGEVHIETSRMLPASIGAAGKYAGYTDSGLAGYASNANIAPSILAEDVCDGDPTNLLMLYSLSKQSNLAGYRLAFIAGDPALIKPLAEVRKHTGMMMPGPMQAVMAKVLDDQVHVCEQREVYARRREQLLAALPAAGLENDPADVAGLYLWVRAVGAPVDAWKLVDALAGIGVIAAPGTFYGTNEECRTHVRMSLTASDRDIRDAAARLPQLNLGR